jgi:Raf kinase inhibitor-like YbhB/YbcL family protein
MVAMSLNIEGFGDGDPIPERFAFCALDGMGGNRNPAMVWSDTPSSTESFVVLCVDADAPTDPTNVNQPGVTVPADLARADFAHWVMIDVSAQTGRIAEAAASDGVTTGGKTPGAGPIGVSGINDFTSWFKGDAEMEGVYGDYDGPCPPANDERVHNYEFGVYALDVKTLGLTGEFGLGDVRAAMRGHVLASASVTGTYTLNPDI